MIYDRLLYQVRQRGFLDLLDLTFHVLRKRAGALSLAAIAGILPCIALNYWLGCDPATSLFFFVCLLVIEVPFATAPLTVVLGDLMFDAPVTLRRVARTLLRGLPSLIITQFLLRGVLLVTVVAYFLFPSRYAFLDEVILLERLSWTSALGRAGALCRGQQGDYFLRWLAQVALATIFVCCFTIGGDAIVSTLFGDELSWSRPRTRGLSGLLFEAAIWIAVAYFGTFRFLAYIDRRIRLEGWELELRLKAAGRALEESAP
jgi:hypothetical protein